LSTLITTCAGSLVTVDKAVELIEHHKPDLAILDIRLADGGLGTEIRARLTDAAQMGILYASGHVLPRLTRASGTAVISKPYRPEDILSGLRIVEQIIQTGEANGPYPATFIVLNGHASGFSADEKDDPRDGAIERILKQQAALAQFGTFTFAAADVQSVLTEAARVCADGLGVSFCKICRYRPEENDLLVVAGIGWHDGLIGQVVSQADNTSPQGRAFLTRQPVVCPNLTKEPTFVPPSFYADHKIVSTVDVIIPGTTRPYGILEIDNPEEHTYDAYDINYLTGFANIIAGAVQLAQRKVATSAAIEEKDRLLTVQRAVLNEKALLARELNHRVRNNLQLIHGMLVREVRAFEADTGPGIGGFIAVSRRVMALSQVYDHLLTSGLSQSVEISQYLRTLCDSLAAMHVERYPNIKVTYDFVPIMLELDLVSTMGLVAAELITNSFEHAFPDGRGSIQVSLVATSAESVTATFRDDGVGFADTGNSKRNGVGLVRRLIEQMEGTATVSGDHGTEWKLKIPIAEPR